MRMAGHHSLQINGVNVYARKATVEPGALKVGKSLDSTYCHKTCRYDS